MNQLEARSLFERLVAVPDDEVDLVQAALALAAEDDEPFDLALARQRLDGLARQGLALLPPTADEVERLDRLNELLFDELAFSGDACDFDDPASSFLNRVMERRTGLPIALSVLYVHVGRRMGLACFGVSFPGHFLAKVQLSGGEVFVDPFRRLRSLEQGELERRVAAAGGGKGKLERAHLAAATPKQILARMLRNLKNLYAKQRDFARAFGAVDRILLCQPDAWEDLRDRGLLCSALGGADAARKDLRRYLQAVPQAADAKEIEAKIAELGRTKVVLN